MTEEFSANHLAVIARAVPRIEVPDLLTPQAELVFEYLRSMEEQGVDEWELRLAADLAEFPDLWIHYRAWKTSVLGGARHGSA